MDTNKKPRAHEKKESGQSVTVNKTDKVETGHGPVGSGPRPGAAPSSGQQPQQQRAQGYQRPANSGYVRRGGLGNNKLLLIVLAIAVIFLLTRSCGSESSSSGGYSQPVVTAVPTAVPTAAPTAAPTQAPVATAAPTEAPVTVSSSARAKRYVPLGNGRDTVTIMVYMCGTDLESNYGMATSDLQEMVKANIASNVNVIVETGGCKAWKNSIVSSSNNEVYKVESGGVKRLASVARKPMVDPSTLSEFIQFCKANYPADRNILIFWDHGGGSISGYGHDELYTSAGTMDLAEIATALKGGGCTFDWIGFDACLMATLETAMVCNDYADYLIASEETEPGTGWYYTNWLTLLSRNTSVDTVTLAKQLMDDFVQTSTAASPKAQVGLSLVDLAEMQGVVPATFNSFANNLTSLLNSSSYATVSNARASARQFAKSSRINQIDLMDFANYVGTPEAKSLAQAIQSCVKYNKTTISHAYGLSIYFPYETTKSVKTAVSTYNSVGMDEAYTKCISSFASMLSSGQLAASASTSNAYASGSSGGDLLSALLGSYLGGGSSYGSSYGSYSSGSSGYGSAYGSSPLGALMGAYTGSGGSSSAGYSLDMNSVASLLSAFSGRSLPEEMDWADAETLERSAEYVSENYIDPGTIFVAVRPDGTKVLSLTDEQWALIQSVELNVFVDDGAGYIDLGYDNVDYEFDGNDLLMTPSGEWMTVGGAPVAYYMTSYTDDDTGYRVTGRIPAMLTSAVDDSGDLDALDGSKGDGSSAGATVTQLVDLEVVFDDENPTGAIIGARPMYVEGGNQAKGDIQLKAGDKIQFLCDYYTYDGAYESTYKLGAPITVGAGGLEVEYSKLNNALSITYRLTDIYSNYYWTPAWDY